MGNFTDEVLTPSSISPHSHPQQETGSIAQSDATESISSHNQIPRSNKNVILQPPPQPTIISEEWTSATIVLTAVISSFIAIILVLLLILAALLFRQRLVTQGKIPPGSGTLIPHYENRHPHSLDFGIGYVSPEDIRKGPMAEYQEPFIDPQFSSFVVASNGLIGHSSSSGNSNNGSNGKGRMAEYYSCTLISNPLGRGTLLNQQQQQLNQEWQRNNGTEQRNGMGIPCMK